LLAALWLLWQVRDATGDEAGGGKRTRCYLFGAGLAAGWAAISNYVAALAVVMLGAYLIFAVRRNRGRLWFACGVAAPLLLVLFYNAACFGMPFTTNYREQAPFQKFEGAFMGVFTWPQWDALLAILFSPFRGVFYFSPVLLVGFYGAWLIARQRRYRAEWWVVVGVVMLYLLFSICYKGWQGGFAVVPRYFVPAAPFLALPVVMGFARRLWPTLAAAIYSVAVGFLIVAVNPFSPLGMHLMVKREGVSQWRHNQITDYLLPLLLRGDLENLISERIEYRVKENDAELAAARYSQEVRDASAQELRRRIRAEIASLENFWYVLLLAEPISANQLGIYEILPCRVFSADRIERKWNSFNVGEFLFPQSRWSLVPLLLVGGALFVALIRAARRHGSEANGLKFL
jgi:hypothetical protein